MKNYIRSTLLTFAVILTVGLAACNDEKSSSEIANERQEILLKDIEQSVGLPNITNYREKRLLKSIYELRDQDGLKTYTYIVAEQTGKPVMLCKSMGYPISDATGYTSPDKIVKDSQYGFGTVIQAEPNGLFTPDVSNGYWVLCADATNEKFSPTFVSGKIVTSAFELSQ